MHLQYDTATTKPCVIHTAVGPSACHKCSGGMHRLCWCKSGKGRMCGGSSSALQQRLACSTCASTQPPDLLCKLPAPFLCSSSCVIWISGRLRLCAMRLQPWPALQWVQMSRCVQFSHVSDHNACKEQDQHPELLCAGRTGRVGKSDLGWLHACGMSSTEKSFGIPQALLMCVLSHKVTIVSNC